MNFSKKLKLTNNKNINKKKLKFHDLKKNNLIKKEITNDTNMKLKSPELKFNVCQRDNSIINDINLINDIKGNNKLLERIKYLQLWWKTIFHIIKIQKHLRGFLHRIKIKSILKLKDNLKQGIQNFYKIIKRIIYKIIIGKIKKICEKQTKIESPVKKKVKLRNNQSLESRKNMNDKDSFSFEKIFMTSRKINEKQKPKIKNIKSKINNNIKYSNQTNSTKRKNINNPKTSDKKETIKIEKNNEVKKFCQCFNTSSNFTINQKNINVHNNNHINSINGNNNKVKKIEISHKVNHKTKKLIKYRNEINNIDKFKSYKPESLKNKSVTKTVVNSSVTNNSNAKKNLELEYISTHEPRFHCPKRLFNLYDDKLNNNNIIRVQKKLYKDNINNEMNEDINIRSKSLENRTNKKYKSFSNKIKKDKKNNNSKSKGKNISDFIKVNKEMEINKTFKIIDKYNTKCKKDMIMWLNTWEKKTNNINNPINSNLLKGICVLINKIISFNNKNNGDIFFNNLKLILKYKILKKCFIHYKNVIGIKNILIQLKENQRIKIVKNIKDKEKLDKLKKLIYKYTSLKKSMTRWKIFIYHYNKFYEEKNIIFNSSDVSNINDDFIDTSNDYFNKSQPEINSLKIQSYNFIKNKYNIPNLKPPTDRNNNINININYNLITNNNGSEKGIYIKKKINVPKTKNYQNKSCFIPENDKDIEDNNIINDKKDFMNNSMITRRIKIKKKENNIYFPKHIKPGNIQNDLDYVSYKNKMQFNNNVNDIRKNKDIIHKKINLKFQKIFDVKNNF